MKTIFNLFLVLLFFLNSLFAQSQTNVGSLEVAYPMDIDLIEDVVLGVNGRVFIYNGDTALDDDNGDPQIGFENDVIENFALIVAGDKETTTDSSGDTTTTGSGGGIVASDLGIGGANVFLTIPDYVFEPDYELKSLDEVQEYVKENKHLPGIISQGEVEEQGYFGVNEMLLGQLKNLEELVLHTIEQEKLIKAQEEENKRLTQWAEDLEKRLIQLENISK